MKIFYILISLFLPKIIEVEQMRIKLPITSGDKLTGWSILSDFDTDSEYVKFNYKYNDNISILHNTLMLYSNYVEYDVKFKLKLKEDEKELKKEEKELKEGTEAIKEETEAAKDDKKSKRDLVFIFNLDNELREINTIFKEKKTNISGFALVGILNLETKKIELTLHYDLEFHELNFLENISLFMNKKNKEIVEINYPDDYNFKIKIDYEKNTLKFYNNDSEIFSHDKINDYINYRKSCFHLYSVSKDIKNSFLLKDIKVYKDTVLNDQEYTDKDYDKIMQSFKKNLDTKKIYEPTNFIDLIQNQNHIELLTQKLYKNTIDINNLNNDLKTKIINKQAQLLNDIDNNKIYKKKFNGVIDSFNSIIDTQENLKSGFTSLENLILNLQKINDIKITSLDTILNDLDVIINLNEMKDIVKNIEIISSFMETSDFDLLNTQLKESLENNADENLSTGNIFFGFLILGVILGLLATLNFKIKKAQKVHIL